MKVIHLMKNNPLMGRLVDLFEKVNPQENKYFVHGEKGALGVANENRYDNDDFVYFSEVSRNLIDQINLEARNAELVFIQAGTTVNQQLLDLIDESIPKHLFFWGFETYLHHQFHYKQIFPATRSFRYENGSKIVGKINYFKRYLKEMQRDKHRFTYLNRISSYSVGFQEEADWMKENIGLNQPYFPFSFYSHSVPDTVNTFDPSCKWLMLGNSSTVTMNHVDAIPYLIEADLDQIIIPLSYGDKNYKEFVKKNFLKKFSENHLTFLEEFMPLEEYESLMGKCGMVYINAYCQQAVGNCINALAKGSALFFPSDSFLSRGFKGLGYQVFEPQDIKTFDLGKHVQHSMKANFELFELERSPESQQQKVIDIIRHYSDHGKA